MVRRTVKSVDLFPRTSKTAKNGGLVPENTNISIGNSAHVETVVLMSRV